QGNALQPRIGRGHHHARARGARHRAVSGQHPAGGYMTTATYTARRRRRIHWGTYAVWIVMFLMAIVFLMPVYVMVANGLKDAQSVSLQRMWVPPAQLSTDNGFSGAWERLSPNLMNSLLMVIPA